MEIPQCDKCGATEFVHLRDGWKPTLVLASEYFDQIGKPRAVPALLVYHSWIARCKACGAEYPYALSSA